MSVSVGKRFEFSASHVIAGLPADHKCGRLHGHTYRITLELTGDLDAIGFVVDFAELDTVSGNVRDKLDHRHLNDVLEFNPTSELLAIWIAAELRSWLTSRPEAARINGLAVSVSEGPSTWAIHRESLIDDSPDL